MAQPAAKILKRPETSEDAAAAARARNKGLRTTPIIQTTAKTDEAYRAAQMADRRLAAVAQRRVRKLQAEFEARAAKSGTAQAFNDAKKRYYDSIVGVIRQDIEREAEKTKLPSALYKHESDPSLGIGIPNSKHYALDDSFANYFGGARASGFANDRDAQKAWNYFQFLNRLARLSIVLVPTVHGINNLGMHYLAEGSQYGASPRDMLDIVTRRKKFSQELMDRAYDDGAATSRSETSFAIHGDRGPLVKLSPKEQARIVSERGGPFSKVAGAATRVGRTGENIYQSMNHWLFHDVEQGYAFDLYDRMTRSGMSGPEAALRIRNTLGRFDNLSPFENAAQLNKIFYFYPWMKTVVPFWVKKGVVDPKWWGAPVRAIQTLNEAQGYDDPSKAFTMTIANLGGGRYVRAIAPVPQRVLEPIADLLRTIPDLLSSIHGGLSGGDIIGQDLAPSARYVLGHLNPALNIGLQGAEAAQQGPERVPPYSTFRTNPEEPWPQAAAQIGGRVAGDIFAPLQRSDTFRQAPAETTAGWLLGSFMYVEKDQGRKYADQRLRRWADGVFAKAAYDARISGNADAVRRVKTSRDEFVQRVLDAADAAHKQPVPLAAPSAPAPTAPAAPAASSNPFIQASP